MYVKVIPLLLCEEDVEEGGESGGDAGGHAAAGDCGEHRQVPEADQVRRKREGHAQDRSQRRLPEGSAGQEEDEDGEEEEAEREEAEQEEARVNGWTDKSDVVFV